MIQKIKDLTGENKNLLDNIGNKVIISDIDYIGDISTMYIIN